LVLRDWYSQADFAYVGTKCDVPPGLSSQFRKTVERGKRGTIPPGYVYIRRDHANDSAE
jgi:hypothetical protein